MGATGIMKAILHNKSHRKIVEHFGTGLRKHIMCPDNIDKYIL